MRAAITAGFSLPSYFVVGSDDAYAEFQITKVL